MRVTILGTGTARPVADSAASGVLVEAGPTAILFDCGSGIGARLEASIGAAALTAIVIGHLHADHWIDLAPIRYRFPWAGPVPRKLPVHFPPGGLPKLAELASAISERPTFFQDAFDVDEYESGRSLAIDGVTVTPMAVGHYVPAWSMAIDGPDGERMVYAGDMGPSDAVVALANDADLLILEATLASGADDDVQRGHLSTEEAIDIARRSGARRTLLVHYPSERRARIQALCDETDGLVVAAVPGTTVELSPRR